MSTENKLSELQQQAQSLNEQTRKYIEDSAIPSINKVQECAFEIIKRANSYTSIEDFQEALNIAVQCEFLKRHIKSIEPFLIKQQPEKY